MLLLIEDAKKFKYYTVFGTYIIAPDRQVDANIISQIHKYVEQ